MKYLSRFFQPGPLFINEVYHTSSAKEKYPVFCETFFVKNNTSG